MKVTIINLPSPVLAEPWTNFPLGCGVIAAVAEGLGHDADILDLCEVDPDGLEAVSIPSADVFGLSVVTPQIFISHKMAAILRRKFPEATIVAGGPHTLIDGGIEDFLLDMSYDAVVKGEGEFGFERLLGDREAGRTIQSVYDCPPPPDLDKVPYPARHLMPDFQDKALRTVQLFKGDYTEGGQTTAIASRGCPYYCSFCALHPRTMRFQTPRHTVAELQHVVEQFGIRQFKWQDDTFSISKPWVLELCDLIKNELPPTYHRSHTRINVFDAELAKAQYDAGFRLQCFGIESMSQTMLDLNDKKLKVGDIEEKLKIAHDAGMKTVGFFIFGMPGETPQTNAETMANIEKNIDNLDFVNMTTMIPLPGTPMWDRPEDFDCEILERDYEKLWIVGHDDNDRIMVTTNGVSRETMAAEKVKMYDFLRDIGRDRPEWKKPNEYTPEGGDYAPAVSEAGHGVNV